MKSRSEMARGKRSFRGAELVGKGRVAKYQRKGEGKRNSKPKQDKVPYDEIIYENAAFETYYRAQAICSAEEWDDFMAIQRLRLPAAVRINVSAPLWRSTRAFLTRLSQEGGKNPVKQLPFFPHQLAWQWDSASKVDMKKDEGFKEIREQIINEDFRGVITRQEAVSMLPCLFLDIQPHHLVLDMCSSPGSKTSEMLDMLQWQAQLHLSKESKVSVGIQPVEGAVIANDVDLKRAVTLTHQVQKLASPCIAVCCLDAAFFPTIHEETGDDLSKAKLQFDRILADVPCSGDGTLRKNMDVWKSWNTGGGHSMHAIQVSSLTTLAPEHCSLKEHELSILYRGLQLLRVGGKIVYSTCSMNPLEDEAVIATILSQQEGRVEIVEPPGLPGLKWMKGKSFWVVPSPPAKRQSTDAGSGSSNAKDGGDIVFYRTFEEVPEEFRHRIRPTMFPPPGAESMPLDRCVRVLPHHNNTGGFFVCCLRKVGELHSSRIFVSNKSRDKVAARENKEPRAKSNKRAEPPSCPVTKGAETASGDDAKPRNPGQTADNAPAATTSSTVEPEFNPLLDGKLLPEGSNEAAPYSGDVDSDLNRTTTPGPVGGEDSLYSLAAAASRPGGLFHLLLPATCDAKGLEEVQLIANFFGLSNETSLMPDDLREPSSVPSFSPDLLFRRVHSRKKIFLLSKKLADLVNACNWTTGARRQQGSKGDQSPQAENQTELQASEPLRQVQGLLSSKIRWMHAGATVLIKHSESQSAKDQDFGARGWRVAQEGAALMACVMKRRIIFASLTVARMLLLPDTRVIRGSDLEGLEARKQLVNLSSCRSQNGFIQAGGAVCVICPESVIPTDEPANAGAHKTPPSAQEMDGTGGLGEHASLASTYPAVKNPNFVTLADSFCVACMITRGGNVHAYMNKKEAKAIAAHLFSMPNE